MPVDKEACSLLAETIGILLGELADEPATIPHTNLIVKEAEYLCKKAWTTASIAGHIAVRYGGATARAARAAARKATPRPVGRKRKAMGPNENGQPINKKPRRKKPVPAEKAKKPRQEAKPRPSKACPRPASAAIRKKPRQESKQAGGKTTTMTTTTTNTEDLQTPVGVGVEGEGGVWRGVTDAEVMQRELEKVPYFRDPSFKASFHMERSTFQALCEVVGFKVAGRTVSPYSKLLGVLWWLAGRESMKQIVRRFDWSIGTFHGAVHLFSTAIVEHLMPQTIRWPSLEQEVKRCLLDFQHSYNFQGVMGCLGACRLPLRLRSAKRGAPYRDPNGRPSILLQAVCDANRRFLHVSAGWPGTTAEHAAFHESDLPGLLDKLPEYAQVLASGDYPARSHVWVPFCAGSGGPLTEEMLYFNGLHAGGMAALGRTERLLKNTWQRLELLEMLPDRIPSVVLAACALLNFILQREHVVGDDRFPVLSGSGFDPATPTDTGGTGSGKKKKTLTL